jgi:hypothetical protein
MKEIKLEEFGEKFLFKKDYLFLSIIICDGHKRFDPIILLENRDIPGRYSTKFPGTSFEPKMLKKGFLTEKIKNALKHLGYSDSQYRFWLSFYEHQDELAVSDQDDFKKAEYLLFFKKILTLTVLEKTGLFVEVSDEPFYLDMTNNQKNPDSNAYRLFFEAKTIVRPVNKDNKLFFDKNKYLVKFLNANHYNQIIEVMKRGVRFKKSLNEKLLHSYWAVLLAYDKKR